MNQLVRVLLCLGLTVVFSAHAQLSVAVSPLKTTGDKALIELALKNNFTNKIESARATVFLTDNQGKIAGTATKWVIGGTKDRPALEPAKETTYNFVISPSRPLADTNLTAKVVVNRLILEGGRVADANKDVQIQNTK